MMSIKRGGIIIFYVSITVAVCTIVTYYISLANTTGGIMPVIRDIMPKKWATATEQSLLLVAGIVTLTKLRTNVLNFWCKSALNIFGPNTHLSNPVFTLWSEGIDFIEVKIFFDEHKIKSESGYINIGVVRTSKMEAGILGKCGWQPVKRRGGKMGVCAEPRYHDIPIPLQVIESIRSSSGHYLVVTVIARVRNYSHIIDKTVSYDKDELLKLLDRSVQHRFTEELIPLGPRLSQKEKEERLKFE